MITKKSGTASIKIRRRNKMKYKTEILEFARLACACIPDTIVDKLDMSDDYFLEIRNYIQMETDANDMELILDGEITWT